jgi:RimJ/RimL family protein N-acetyltransferase
MPIFEFLEFESQRRVSVPSLLQMKGNDVIQLREVLTDDLEIFFEDQRDPVAAQMAAFASRERDEFMAHWTKILGMETVIARTILFEGQIVGNVVCFEESGQWLIGYWIGKRFWGNGIATKALATFLKQVEQRPLHAYVWKRNVGSVRVLEKCGFTLSMETDGGEELVYTLPEVECPND